MPSSWLRSAIQSVSVAIWRAPVFGYHSKDSRAFAMASSRVGRADGHGEGGGLVVHEGADGRRAVRDGGPVDVDLALDLRRRQADGEGAQAQPEVAHLGVALVAGGGPPERRVRLLPAAWAAPGAGASASARPRTRTRRWSSSPTTCSIASCHIWRLSAGSMPKPSSSARVAERPVPRSTRPLEIRSSTATDSAVRTGWL